MSDRTAILAALYAWIVQRPRLEYGNYGDAAAYRSELRRIARQKNDALAMLSYVGASHVTGEQMAAAFSGRLSWDGQKLNYCTGQYWPTEYRAAACAVLAAAIWSYWREGLTGEKQGDRLRTCARREFGRGIAARWFN